MCANLPNACQTLLGKQTHHQQCLSLQPTPSMTSWYPTTTLCVVVACVFMACGASAATSSEMVTGEGGHRWKRVLQPLAQPLSAIRRTPKPKHVHSAKPVSPTLATPTTLTARTATSPGGQRKHQERRAHLQRQLKELPKDAYEAQLRAQLELQHWDDLMATYKVSLGYRVYDVCSLGPDTPCSLCAGT